MFFFSFRKAKISLSVVSFLRSLYIVSQERIIVLWGPYLIVGCGGGRGIGGMGKKELVFDKLVQFGQSRDFPPHRAHPSFRKAIVSIPKYSAKWGA